MSKKITNEAFNQAIEALAGAHLVVTREEEEPLRHQARGLVPKVILVRVKHASKLLTYYIDAGTRSPRPDLWVGTIDVRRDPAREL